MHELFNLPCGPFLDMSSRYNLKREAESHFNESYDKLAADVNKTLACLSRFSGDYLTSHLLLTAGADYSFVHAEIQYTFLDKVIKLLNKQFYTDPATGKTRVFLLKYSSVDGYFQAVRTEAIDK
jgi:hypothetical protein